MNDELCFFFFLFATTPDVPIKLELVGPWKLEEAPEKEIEDLFDGLL